MRVYLAGPLFNVAERRFLAALRDDLNALPGVRAQLRDGAGGSGSEEKPAIGGSVPPGSFCPLIP